ncbi:VacJ family lipoprotein [Pseudoxanthomonas helianthi]|uniref:VacJ family lipoprotein n=1 Tax=Pseudoxanthomonas helianthi TaxID=1453541 RepID=A0A941AT63_9GAMM|nr:VacJ family lipoprotein [Pseudoxanthomonas helianthi]MBP3983865.1 VacJ family lipoprotein [Pseudoxanthomonas helianthi]
MKPYRIAFVVLFAALASACASAPKPAASAPVEPALVDGSTSVAAAEPAAQTPPLADDAQVVPPADAATHAVPADTAGSASAGTANAAEDDFAAIYGQDAYNPVADPNLPPEAQLPTSYDPWEKFNRKMHRFNNAVDRAVAKPLARGYVKVVPRPIRLGIGNFFDNLGQPLTIINSLLQGKPGRAGQALGRFLLNSTLGIGGLFDPASDAGLPRKSEDFGQTLGTWGWKRSRYVELPLFGPRTVRDVFGLVGDAPLSPVRQIEEDRVRLGLQGLNLVNVRADLLPLDAQREGVPDDYALVRDAWLQRRSYQIESDRKHKADEELPDYLKDEEENPTVPMDAMPAVVPMQGGG